MTNPQSNNTFSYFGYQGTEGIKFDPNNYKIVTQPRPGQLPNTWIYTQQSHEYPGGVQLTFTASQPPILGDQVVAGVLVPRPIVPNPARDVFQNGWPQPIINNDPGFQKKKFDRHQDVTWPDDKVWVDRVDTKW